MRVVNLSKTYGDRTVLRVEELTLEPGRLYSVIGPNGSGKSTPARVLSGRTAPDDRAALRDFDPKKVGFLPQKPYGFQMSVLRNVLLTTKRTEEDKARAMALLEDFGIENLASKKGHRLSGGETARMAMARIMMQHYDLLILDEPTAAMDMGSTIRAEELILRYREQHGCTLLLITHSLAQARRVADEVLFFRQGQLWEQGSAKQVLSEPRRPETKEFLDFYGV